MEDEDKNWFEFIALKAALAPPLLIFWFISTTCHGIVFIYKNLRSRKCQNWKRETICWEGKENFADIFSLLNPPRGCLGEEKNGRREKFAFWLRLKLCISLSHPPHPPSDDSFHLILWSEKGIISQIKVVRFAFEGNCKVFDSRRMFLKREK